MRIKVEKDQVVAPRDLVPLGGGSRYDLSRGPCNELDSKNHAADEEGCKGEPAALQRHHETGITFNSGEISSEV